MMRTYVSRFPRKLKQIGKLVLSKKKKKKIMSALEHYCQHYTLDYKLENLC